MSTGTGFYQNLAVEIEIKLKSKHLLVGDRNRMHQDLENI